MISTEDASVEGTTLPRAVSTSVQVSGRGYFTADGEGYGATQALRLAANAVERQLLKGKTYGQSLKRPDAEEREELYGWWLGG